MLQPFFPVLAAGISIWGMTVLTFAIVSWIVNLVRERKPEAPRPRNRPRPNNSSQSELERFLQEVVKKNEPEKNRAAPPKAPRPAGGEKRKSKQPQSPAQPQPQSPRNAPLARPITRLAPSLLAGSSALGQGVRSHVATHMEPRNVDTLVDRDISAGVRRDIDSNVQRDLGTDLGKDTTLTVQRAVAVHPLMQVLRNPQGVRQAILMAEILNRPKSLR